MALFGIGILRFCKLKLSPLMESPIRRIFQCNLFLLCLANPWVYLKDLSHFSQLKRIRVIKWFAFYYKYIWALGDTGFFRLQCIKVLWRLQFLGYFTTLSLKFQKARTKIEVVLGLPCWLSQLNWDRHQNLRSSNTPKTVLVSISWYLEV